MSEWIEVDRARVRMRTDGIAEIQHNAHVQYTGPLARGHMERLRELLTTPKAPLMVVVPDGFRLDEEARTYLLKSDDIRDHVSSGALLMGSRPEAVAVNLFLKFGRPVCPMKAFHRERDAIAWLR